MVVAASTPAQDAEPKPFQGWCWELEKKKKTRMMKCYDGGQPHSHAIKLDYANGFDTKTGGGKNFRRAPRSGGKLVSAIITKAKQRGKLNRVRIASSKWGG